MDYFIDIICILAIGILLYMFNFTSLFYFIYYDFCLMFGLLENLDSIVYFMVGK